MSSIYSYRAELSTRPVDVTGFEVEASDGSIGKIDEASNETSASCFVVDTGFWIFGKKRMIPAGVVRAIDTEDHKVYVSMTKDEIKNAPDFDPDEYRTDQQKYRSDVGTYYSRYSS